MADSEDIQKLYDIKPIVRFNHDTYDGIIITVAHQKFKDMGQTEILKLCKKNHAIYDLKYLFTKDKFNL